MEAGESEGGQGRRGGTKREQDGKGSIYISRARGNWWKQEKVREDREGGTKKELDG